MAGDDGWTVVPLSKAAAYRKKKAEEAAAEETKKQKEAEQEKIGYNAMNKKKKKDEEESPKEEKKKVLTEEEKAQLKKERRKEEKAAKERAAKKAAQASPKTSPKAQQGPVLVTTRATHIPESVLSGVAELPVRYQGRVKEQFNTAVEYLDSWFIPSCCVSANYKSVPTQERWSMPLAALPSSCTLLASLEAIVDGSDDNYMWNAAVKDLIVKAFGRGCTRPDDGKHYLGSKMALQVLLARKPGAFNVSPGSVVDLFQLDGETLAPSAAVNYAWVMAQLRDGAAIQAVLAWSRLFFSKLVGNFGKNGGITVEIGYAVADQLAQLKPSDDAKKEYRSKHGADPLSLDQLLSVTRLLAPKRNKLVRLFQRLVPAYSVLFTPQSPRAYFNRLALQLRTANEVGTPLLLDVLVECMVQDSGPHGVLHTWTNDLLPLIKESNIILEHVSKQQSALRTRLNGKQIEKFLQRLTDKCHDIQSGKLVPEGKKQKLCEYEAEDVDKLLSWVRKCSGLTKAVPLDAPISKKQLRKVKQEIVAQQKARSSGFCGKLFSLILFICVLFLAAMLALPFIPPETLEQINKNVVDTDAIVSQVNVFQQSALKQLAELQARLSS